MRTTFSGAPPRVSSVSNDVDTSPKADVASPPAAEDNTPDKASTAVPVDSPSQLVADASTFSYSNAERAQIDAMIRAYQPVVEAVGVIENFENWARDLVFGVRAIRDRAFRESGTTGRQDYKYKKRFGALLAAEKPIGPFLLHSSRHAELDAVHYLGQAEGRFDDFIAWTRTLESKHRTRWRTLRTLVGHYKRRIKPPAAHVEAETITPASERSEAVPDQISPAEKLWRVIEPGGPELVVEVIREQRDRAFGRRLVELLQEWLREPEGSAAGLP